jgi:hypothetical protein
MGVAQREWEAIPKTCDTPVEALEDIVSDRGSTPLASTTICLKSLIYQAFRRFSGEITNPFEDHSA